MAQNLAASAMLAAMRAGNARRLALDSGNPATTRVRHSSTNRARATDHKAAVSSDDVAAAEVKVAPAQASNNSSPASSNLVNSNPASSVNRVSGSSRASRGQAPSRMLVSICGDPTGGLAARMSDPTASIRIASRIPAPVVVMATGNNDRSVLPASVSA